MKKYSIVFISAVLAFAGCNKDNTLQSISEQYPVFSSVMEDLGTKTELGEDRSVVWNENDLVAVFNKTTGLLQYKAKTGGSSETELEAVGGTGSGAAISANVAFYPYSESMNCSENAGTFSITTSLAATQTYKSASFGVGAAPMMAVSSTENFSFKNVFGCLKLQFTGSGKVKSITVKGNNGETLAGDVVVSMTADGNPVYNFTDNLSATVTLDCGVGVALSDTPTPFYISLPGREYSKGISVNVTMVDGTIIPEISTPSSIVVGRSAIRPMAACKLVGITSAQMDQTKFKIKFCNSCYAYTACNTAQTSGTEADGEFGKIRTYDHTNIWGQLGSFSPKLLIDGKNDTGWTSLHGNLGTLCQNTETKAETKFDDYDYSFSKLSEQFHAFGGRRVQVSIVIDMNEVCDVASIGLVNFNRIAGDGKTVVAHLKSVEFYVSNDAEFTFTPAYGKDRSDYDYSNYANPNENNWTLIAKSSDIGFSTDKDNIKWVDVPYSLLASGKAKGRFLKIRFPESAGKYDGRTGFSAKELYVKKATNLD